MRPKVREDKDETARCPFCRRFLKVPEEIKTGTGEILGGRCECGAVYVADPTGHNMGEAYLDALAYACGGDWSVCNTLAPDERYREAVYNYDPRSHKLREPKDVRRDYSGKIIFVKLDKEC
ncbi:MAG: hypothetical protein M1497_13165 [Nitrospirae bacterium]|nr:hypothetical protein [Nitrospirota bacterium]